MGTYNGYILETEDYPTPDADIGVRTGAKQTELESSAHRNDLDYGTADIADRGMTDISTEHDGLIWFSYGDEVLFYRIWFEPYTIDAGFIVEDEDHLVKIWNAYFDQTASITAIDGTATEGTSITYDSLPITIGKFADYEVTVTVLRVGPPLQETVYTFTINAVDYETAIDGIRVVSIPWDPDWDNKIRIEMGFDTALSRTKYFVEQRKWLRENARYKLQFTATNHGLEAQKMKQIVAYGHDKVFGVPIYSEQAYPSADFTSSSIITTSNDLDKMWYLNNQAEYVVIIDHVTNVSEIKEIDSVSVNQIDLINPVSGTFSYLSSKVYPIVMCLAESISIQPHAAEALRASFNMVEYVRSDA
jgi:hypothetical protein